MEKLKVWRKILELNSTIDELSWLWSPTYLTRGHTPPWLCKIKYVLNYIMWWTIGIEDYWFWYLEFICEVVLEMIGFHRWSTSTANWVRSDRARVAGQTGGDRATRPASSRYDRPTLCQFRFRVVCLDIRDCFMFMFSRRILCVCNTVVCY